VWNDRSTRRERKKKEKAKLQVPWTRKRQDRHTKVSLWQATCLTSWAYLRRTSWHRSIILFSVPAACIIVLQHLAPGRNHCAHWRQFIPWERKHTRDNVMYEMTGLVKCLYCLIICLIYIWCNCLQKGSVSFQINK